MDVNDALEIKIAPALIAKNPFDHAVEFEIERVSIFEPSPVPTPQPFDELDALTTESTIANESILDSSTQANRLRTAAYRLIIIIHLLGLAPAGYLTAPDNGA
jgi:hypothetical protein